MTPIPDGVTSRLSPTLIPLKKVLLIVYWAWGARAERTRSGGAGVLIHSSSAAGRVPYRVLHTLVFDKKEKKTIDVKCRCIWPLFRFFKRKINVKFLALVFVSVLVLVFGVLIVVLVAEMLRCSCHRKDKRCYASPALYVSFIKLLRTSKTSLIYVK